MLGIASPFPPFLDHFFGKLKEVVESLQGLALLCCCRELRSLCAEQESHSKYIENLQLFSSWDRINSLG